MKKHALLIVVAAVLSFVSFATTAAADGHDARVRAWIVDPHGEVDGMVLSDQASVRFDRMTGESITRHVRLGDRVQITPDGQALFLPRTNWSVDLGMATVGLGGGPSRLPPVSRAERAVDGMTVSGGLGTGTQHFTVRGVVRAVTFTRGRVADGFVLDGGVTVRIPTSRTDALAALRPGMRVDVEGEGVRGRYGIGVRATRVVSAGGSVVLGEGERLARAATSR
jgi:hypothetical protein